MPTCLTMTSSKRKTLCGGLATTMQLSRVWCFMWTTTRRLVTWTNWCRTRSRWTRLTSSPRQSQAWSHCWPPTETNCFSCLGLRSSSPRLCSSRRGTFRSAPTLFCLATAVWVLARFQCRRPSLMKTPRRETTSLCRTRATSPRPWIRFRLGLSRKSSG